MNLHERVLNVLSCRHVDEVVIGIQRLFHVVRLPLPAGLLGAPWVLTPDLIKSLNISVVVSGR